ncbi:hypothetical protein GFL91_04780 [Rhizobium leguminosarum bv. viciae]|uniref:Uncharacterized protein n=1 Tax=Rhizobium leguminosarum bv. viciae TaxID=387 RepID=A0A8I2GKP6_RHILV|nr:hypothetical protein [Rhizobium leguminosarum]NKM44314.1 hypothetical protein [Rhizobium leguminosarum bv. viciae]
MTNENHDGKDAPPPAARLEREELYKLVWSVPGRILGPRLGVSDSYLSLVCRSMAIPRPPPGYWGKAAAGKAGPTPALPESRAGRPTSWTRGQALTSPIRQFYSRLDQTLENGHSLVEFTRERFATARTGPGGIYLTTRSTRVIDLATSTTCLDRALSFAEALFGALEARGHEVTIAAGNLLFRPDIPFSERRHERRGTPVRAPRPTYPTVAIIRGTPLGLAIGEIVGEVEMTYVGDGNFVPRSKTLKRRTEKVAGFTWSEWRAHPTGKLKLVAYAPNRLDSRRPSWTEGTGTKLTRTIEEIVGQLEAFSDSSSSTA